MLKKDWLKSYLIVSFGTLLITLDMYFFKFPNNFSIGGVSGLSTIMSALFPVISKSTAAFIINTFWLIIGFIFFGRGFAIKTVYSSILMNVILFILELIVPMSAPFTNQRFMELIYSTLLTAFGTALLFNEDASSGGMDVAALLLKRYTSLQVGRAMFICNILIVTTATVLFGIEIGMYSLMGLLAKTFVVDAFLENMNTVKCFQIITDHKTEINDYILNVLGKGVTHLKCEGGYTNAEKSFMIAVMKPKEGKMLKKFIEKEYPDSFFVIYKSSEIFGGEFVK